MNDNLKLFLDKICLEDFYYLPFSDKGYNKDQVLLDLKNLCMLPSKDKVNELDKYVEENGFFNEYGVELVEDKVVSERAFKDGFLYPVFYIEDDKYDSLSDLQKAVRNYLISSEKQQEELLLKGVNDPEILYYIALTYIKKEEFNRGIQLLNECYKKFSYKPAKIRIITSLIDKDKAVIATNKYSEKELAVLFDGIEDIARDIYDEENPQFASYLFFLSALARLASIDEESNDQSKQKEEALKLLDNVIEYKDINILARAGELFYSPFYPTEKNEQLARKYIDVMLEQYPYNPKGHLSLAKCYLAFDHYDEAEKKLLEIEKSFNTDEVYQLLGELYSEHRFWDGYNIDNAIKYLELGFSKTNDGCFLNLIGNIYLNINNDKQLAKKYYQEAVDNGYYQSLINLYLLSGVKDTDGDRSYLDQAKEHDVADAYYYLGKKLHSSNDVTDFNAADEEYKAGLSIDEYNTNCLTGRAELYSSNKTWENYDLEEAETLFKIDVLVNYNYDSCYGLFLLKEKISNNHDDNIEILKHGARWSDKGYLLYYKLGQIYCYGTNGQDINLHYAKKYFKKCLEKKEYAWAYYELFNINVEEKNYYEAYLNAEAVSKLDPRFYVVLGKGYEEGRVSNKKNKLPKIDLKLAREYYEKAATIGHNPDGYAYIGLLYEKEGNYLQAKKFFEKALEIGSSSLAALHLSRLYKDGKAGLMKCEDRLTEAYTILNKYYGDNPELAFELGRYIRDGIGCEPKLKPARRIMAKAVNDGYEDEYGELEEISDRIDKLENKDNALYSFGKSIIKAGITEKTINKIEKLLKEKLGDAYQVINDNSKKALVTGLLTYLTLLKYEMTGVRLDFSSSINGFAKALENEIKPFFADDFYDYLYGQAKYFDRLEKIWKFKEDFSLGKLIYNVTNTPEKNVNKQITDSVLASLSAREKFDQYNALGSLNLTREFRDYLSEPSSLNDIEEIYDKDITREECVISWITEINKLTQVRNRASHTDILTSLSAETFANKLFMDSDLLKNIILSINHKKN